MGKTKLNFTDTRLNKIIWAFIGICELCENSKWTQLIYTQTEPPAKFRSYYLNFKGSKSGLWIIVSGLLQPTSIFKEKLLGRLPPLSPYCHL